MLFEQREVVRNHHVRQIEYRLGEYISKGDTDVYSILSHYENKSLKDFYTHYVRKDILKDVIRDPYEYYYLYQKYTEAKNAGDNDEFSLSYKVNPKQNLVINDKIYVYHFPSRIRIGKRKLFPWDYPDSISDVGNSYHYNDKEIIYDFIMIGYLSFYFKYRLNIMKDHLLNKSDIKKVDSGVYMVDDKLKIQIDQHIKFIIPGKEEKTIYIADSWWHTNEEIIEYLLRIPTANFGLDFKVNWG